ncbi:hypothetical protein DMA11_05625 [Marinilabiliaceae bacterium JC017]|nr:hypothetical protein DMA11_05625 [Marinilabiliaceae bacterium JC017]
MKKFQLLLAIVLMGPLLMVAQTPELTSEKTETSDLKTDQSEVTNSKPDNFWRKHNVKFAAVPIINYDPSLELNMAALANAFFRVNPTDTISPLSMAGAMVGYTTNETWYWALYTKLYFNQDNYRFTLGYGDASVNFQYYDEIGAGFIDFNTLHDALFIELQRRVYKRWYLGLKFVSHQTLTSFDDDDGESGEPQRENMTNLGIVVSHDTRDFIYNPHSGDYLNFKTGHYRDAWGAKYEYDKYEFDFTKFFALSKNEVIAARATALVATGDVPFEGQYVVGRDDIRGYADGKHRADQVYNIQGEYRWNFYKKWGMVAFAGIATAVDNPSEINFKDLLPGGGVGLRYMAIPSEKINIGMDVAVGRNDWGLYFRIAETFGDK